VPEVVEPGVTGFVADAPADLAGQVAAAARLDRTAVRAAAERRFSVSSMVDAYEAAYVAARATR
jgi:hypothetical protein